MKYFPAEWETQSVVQLTFPNAQTDWKTILEEVTACYLEIVKHISQRQKVLLVTTDILATQKIVVPLENIAFAEIPINDTWARDYASISIFEDRKPILLDFTFNGWGNKFEAKKDNQISKHLFEQGFFSEETTLKKLDFVLEGGAIESNGNGILLTTSSCLLHKNRNPKFTKQEISDLLKSVLGIEKILWLDFGHLQGDDTDGHIDTLARFCNENTIVYTSCDNRNDGHFKELQQMEAQLQTFTNLKNKPFQLVSLPMPTACYDENNHRLAATYTNFLIINDAVLVPTYGVSEDEKALKIIENCFPNSEIIGINCLSLIRQGGSLHCATMQFPKAFF